MSDWGADQHNLPQIWIEKFKSIDALPHGPDGRPTLNRSTSQQRWQTSRVWGLIFGPFYYIKLGLYQKAAILFATFAALTFFEHVVGAVTGLIIPDAISIGLSYIVYFFCFHYAALDYYKLLRFGEKFWGPVWLRSNKAVAVVTGSSYALCFLSLVAFSSPIDILTQVSGVWRVDSATVIVDLVGTEKTITLSGAVLTCGVKNSYPEREIVVLNCLKGDGVGSAIVAIEKNIRADGSFTISLTVNDRAEMELSYVRPL